MSVIGEREGLNIEEHKRSSWRAFVKNNREEQRDCGPFSRRGCVPHCVVDARPDLMRRMRTASCVHLKLTSEQFLHIRSAFAVMFWNPHLCFHRFESVIKKQGGRLEDTRKVILL